MMSNKYIDAELRKSFHNMFKSMDDTDHLAYRRYSGWVETMSSMARRRFGYTLEQVDAIKKEVAEEMSIVLDERTFEQRAREAYEARVKAETEWQDILIEGYNATPRMTQEIIVAIVQDNGKVFTS